MEENVNSTISSQLEGKFLLYGMIIQVTRHTYVSFSFFSYF